jgi:hypothetical protein
MPHSLRGLSLCNNVPEKLTKQILIGHTRTGRPIKIWIGATLHKLLTAICARNHNEYRQAFLMAAETGAPMLIQEASNVAVIERDSMRSITVTLSDEGWQRLQAYASKNFLSREQAATECLESKLYFAERCDFENVDVRPQEEEGAGRAAG